MFPTLLSVRIPLKINVVMYSIMFRYNVSLHPSYSTFAICCYRYSFFSPPFSFIRYHLFSSFLPPSPLIRVKILLQSFNHPSHYIHHDLPPPLPFLYRMPSHLPFSVTQFSQTRYFHNPVFSLPVSPRFRPVL